MSSSLTIRRYEDKDYEQVQALFARGMRDNMPKLWRDALRGPTTLAGISVVLIGAAWLASALPRPQLLLVLGAVATACAAAVYLLVRWGLEKYIRYSLGDDLSRIPQFYSGGGSYFWVAELEGKVVGVLVLQVGTLAIERKSNEEGELRRMSVMGNLRRAGIASRLAKELIAYAHAQHMRRVFLVTTSAQEPALRLYKKLGWTTEKVWRTHSGFEFHKLTLDVPAAAKTLGLSDQINGYH